MRAAFLLAALLFAAPCGAEPVKPGSLTVDAAWARASAGVARAGAAYLTIVNAGAADDRLIGVASPVASRVEIHSHAMNEGVMRMRRIEAVRIPAGESAELGPGGDHVMLIGLAAPLRKGETFPLTLTFETAGAIAVPVAILPITARGPAKAHRGHR